MVFIVEILFVGIFKLICLEFWPSVCSVGILTFLVVSIGIIARLPQ